MSWPAWGLSNALSIELCMNIRLIMTAFFATIGSSGTIIILIDNVGNNIICRL